MERIAVISDIHANIHALNVFMDYIDNECEVSKVLNLGDFIQIGPNPAEVYDTVMHDSRFVNIMGNSEYMFCDNEIMKKYESEASHQEWTRQKLGTQRMEGLKRIPLQRIIEIEGIKFLMIHARMNSVIDAPLLYARKTLEEFIADYEEAVNYVLIGHTHLPLYAVHWNNKPILNPGSVGCGKDDVVRFIVLEIEDGLVNVTYKQLKYDKDKVLCDYRKNAVPCSDRFIDMFY